MAANITTKQWTDIIDLYVAATAVFLFDYFYY